MSNYNYNFIKLSKAKQPKANTIDSQGRKYYPYFPSDGLVKAVELAIALQRPLLLEGDPGCGKTELAKALVYQLTQNNPETKDGQKVWWPFFIWNVKSYSRARDGLYTFDAVERLRDAQMVGINHSLGIDDGEALKIGEATTNPSSAALDAGEAATDPDNTNPKKPLSIRQKVQDPSQYLRYGALGQAIQCTDRRAVVLIDEVDKADSEFGNDLLLELDQFWFEIPEINKIIPAPPEPPIVILTSNREKPLPDAFLRRCLYFRIGFPDKEQLTEIAETRFKDTAFTGTPDEQKQLFEAAIDCFNGVRAAMKKSPTSRQPSTSEFIDFLKALRREPAEERSKILGNLAAHHFLGILLKTQEDQDLYLKVLERQKQGGS